MDENILRSIDGCDESKALGFIEPLDMTLHSGCRSCEEEGGQCEEGETHTEVLGGSDMVEYR